MNNRIKGLDSIQRSAVVFMSVICIYFTGCNSVNEPANSNSENVNSQRIVAANYALQYLAQRVAGPDFKVEFPAANSDDPKKWSPSVSDIAAMQKSDLIVVNGPGAAYAAWLERITVPASKICKTSDDFGLDDYITVKNYQIVHAHGPEGEHSHPYFVPYPWLDPRLAIKQGEKICSALSAVYPQRKEEFETNFRDLKNDLDELVSLIESSKFESQVKVVSTNPLLKFLTRALQIQERHLLWMESTDFDNTQAAVEQLAKQLADFQTTHVLVGGELPAAFLNEIEKLSIEIHHLQLLDFKPVDGDFLDVCRQNIQTLIGIK